MLKPDSTIQNVVTDGVDGMTNHNIHDIQNTYRNFSHFIEIFNHVIDALGEFKNRYDKKFNISELSKYLRIPNADINDLTSLILNFQEKYESVFNNYHLNKKVIKNKIYLVAERKAEKQFELTQREILIPKIINIKEEHAKILSDIIYTFQYVKRGKAFNLNSSDSKLLENLKILKETHPYFFNYNLNGLIYPSEVGLQLGNIIHSYNKSNKKIENLVIENTTIIFD